MGARTYRGACLLIGGPVWLLCLSSGASAQDWVHTALTYAQQNSFVLFLAGLFTGIVMTYAVSVLFFSYFASRASIPQIYSSRNVIAQVTVLYIVFAAVVAGEISWTQGIFAAVAGVMAIIAATRAVERFGQGDRVELQSHWGGLGGGLGGWRLSPGASLLILALMLSSIGIAGLVALSKGALEKPPAEGSARGTDAQTPQEGHKPPAPEKPKSE